MQWEGHSNGVKTLIKQHAEKGKHCETKVQRSANNENDL